MPAKTAIPESTRNAILEAAWALAVDGESLDLPQATMAKAAGVSRQTIYLAFGGRAHLLQAMLDHRDAQCDEPKRLAAIREGARGTWDEFEAYVDAWLDYLPKVYPVAMLLMAAADSDPVAAAAYNGRFHDRLRHGLRSIASRVGAAGGLHPDLGGDEAGDLAWSLVHPLIWRVLVVESGWTPDAFRASRKRLLAAALRPA